VIAEGTSGELKALVGQGSLHVRVLDPEQRAEAGCILTSALDAPFHLESDPAALSARVSDPERVAAALAELARCCVPLAEYSFGQPSLDEVFLTLTGHPAEEATAPEDAA
jgi:ABC-2 type transport system ATP-binding protein